MLEMSVIPHTSIWPNFFLTVLRIKKNKNISVTFIMQQCWWWRHRFRNLWILQKQKSRYLVGKLLLFLQTKIIVTHQGLLYCKNGFVSEVTFKDCLTLSLLTVFCFHGCKNEHWEKMCWVSFGALFSREILASSICSQCTLPLPPENRKPDVFRVYRKGALRTNG